MMQGHDTKIMMKYSSAQIQEAPKSFRILKLTTPKQSIMKLEKTKDKILKASRDF